MRAQTPIWLLIGQLREVRPVNIRRESTDADRRLVREGLSGQVICTCAGFLNSATPGDQCFALIYPDNIDMDNFIRVYSPYDLHGFRGYSQGCGGRDG